VTSPELLVIAGPTASGKTRVAIELAERINAEIINADSQQVYRFFDIGTAKPSVAELARVPHHVLSCVEPTEIFHAARFQQLADAAIADIHARGKRVIVVGGTGLYIRVLLHGVVPAPGSQSGLRAQFETLSNAELHARLAAIDHVSALRLPSTDRVRVIRALEIHALTGEAASAHRERHAFQADRYAFKLFVLNPPREVVYEAINVRAHAMFDAGLLDEVRALVARGYRDAAPMRAVGYVQALACLHGTMTKAQAIDDVAQKTRHYAKRQYTWFKKEVGAMFVPPPFSPIRP
jgi:tRNA dimethylallyltransferase